MSRKRKVYTPAPFESKRATGKFTKIYLDMLESEAFLSLKKSQQALYLFMKSQYWGKESIHHAGETPDSFYFNRYLWRDKYKLYSNDAQFQRDRDALIEHGLIICEANGFNTREKSIYRFSDNWKRYPDYTVSAKDMTVSMLNRYK